MLEQKKVKVLIVDDNKFTTETFEESCKYWGWETVVKYDYESALESIRDPHQEYDLVLLDHELTSRGHEGLALQKEIQSSGKDPIVLGISAMDQNYVEEALGKSPTIVRLKNAYEQAVRRRNHDDSEY